MLLMNQRLQSLKEATTVQDVDGVNVNMLIDSSPQGINDESDLPVGWKVLDERSGWRACPIGVTIA
jgi:hypothetical protein